MTEQGGIPFSPSVSIATFARHSVMLWVGVWLVLGPSPNHRPLPPPRQLCISAFAPLRRPLQPHPCYWAHALSDVFFQSQSAPFSPHSSRMTTSLVELQTTCYLFGFQKDKIWEKTACEVTRRVHIFLRCWRKNPLFANDESVAIRNVL